jgi:hypothetical protein
MAAKDASSQKVRTKSDVIWDQIKDLPVEIYALPDQTLKQHVERLEVTEEQVHLRIKSPAIVPALEEALGKVKLARGERFDMIPTKGFLVVGIVFDPNALLK